MRALDGRVVHDVADVHGQAQLEDREGEQREQSPDEHELRRPGPAFGLARCAATRPRDAHESPPFAGPVLIVP
ncbi:hypothetical protein GCM10010921_11690 [Microbacterium album]|uniref:Uncharacterized protein n=1 Tax=Microbacterium album TaxID=2053191 RepID=A0A917ICZ3_9MICO|nr:hypothetical protein GCM10010921_11690 [Microbacterium album]